MRQLIQTVFKTPLFTHNPIYRWLYLQHIRTLIPTLLPKPKRVIIENTTYCNINCKFCCNSIMKRKKGIMSNNLFNRIIDQCVECGVEEVTAFGLGEPLLDNKYGKKIKYAKDSGIKDVKCITNGILLDKHADSLIDAGLDYLGVTINNNSDIDKVVNNVKYVYDNRKNGKPWILARFKPDTKHLIPRLKPISDKQVVFINLTNWGTKIKGNVPQGVQFPCSNLWTNLYVCWDGRVALCCKDYECREEVGNIKTQKLLDIWEGNQMDEFRDIHLRGVYPSVCAFCLNNTHLVNPWWRV